MGQLRNLTAIIIFSSAALWSSCKSQTDSSHLKTIELEPLRAETSDPDLLLIEKELNATLSCKSERTSASISGTARVTPNQERLEVSFGKATISVTSDATCHLDIFGNPLKIAGMALVKRSNSDKENLLYSSQRVKLESVNSIDDFFRDIGVLYKLFEVDTKNVDLKKR